MKGLLSLQNMQEKKIGRGEDSDPILIIFEDSVLLGVFDGMGGAGGAECVSDYGEDKTKAYVGSRIVKDAIEGFVKKHPESIKETNFREALKSIIQTRYAEEKEKYPPKSKGGLRSALIKEYPTTLAITSIREDDHQYIIDSYWAGDSRNYIWSPKGLFQISIDDLKGNLDPLENLHEDAPMSNCVQADGPFTINHKEILGFKKSDKFLLISATDGCFGYYPSPMDFEKALIDTLRNANSLEEWKERLTMAFSYITADDFSFSIVAIGFKDFKDLKKAFKKSHLINDYSQRRRIFESKVRERKALDEKIAKEEAELNEEINRLWLQYKANYLKFMQPDEER